MIEDNLSIINVYSRLWNSYDLMHQASRQDFHNAREMSAVRQQTEVLGM